MTKIRVSVPFLVRELCSQVCQLLDRPFGLPMQVEVDKPTTGEEPGVGNARIHFEGGAGFKLATVTSEGHCGLSVNIARLEAGIRFPGRKEAAAWIQGIEWGSGPLDWTWDEGVGKARFLIEGRPLERLARNASHRRNGLKPLPWWEDRREAVETLQEAWRAAWGWKGRYCPFEGDFLGRLWLGKSAPCPDCLAAVAAGQMPSPAHMEWGMCCAVAQLAPEALWAFERGEIVPRVSDPYGSGLGTWAWGRPNP